jgi:hypothetical protein
MTEDRKSHQNVLHTSICALRNENILCYIHFKPFRKNSVTSIQNETHSFHIGLLYKYIKLKLCSANPGLCIVKEPKIFIAFPNTFWSIVLTCSVFRHGPVSKFVACSSDSIMQIAASASSKSRRISVQMSQVGT